MIERSLRRLVGAVTRRPLVVLGLTAVLALGGAALALRLEPSAATEPGSGIRTTTTVTPAMALTIRPPMASSTLLTCATVAVRHDQPAWEH